MPKVGDKNFPYTQAGKAAAKEHAMETGQDIIPTYDAGGRVQRIQGYNEGGKVKDTPPFKNRTYQMRKDWDENIRVDKEPIERKQKSAIRKQTKAERIAGTVKKSNEKLKKESKKRLEKQKKQYKKGVQVDFKKPLEKPKAKGHHISKKVKDWYKSLGQSKTNLHRPGGGGGGGGGGGAKGPGGSIGLGPRATKLKKEDF
mgnify:CR=1 FL=1